MIKMHHQLCSLTNSCKWSWELIWLSRSKNRANRQCEKADLNFRSLFIFIILKFKLTISVVDAVDSLKTNYTAVTSQAINYNVYWLSIQFSHWRLQILVLGSSMQLNMIGWEGQQVGINLKILWTLIFI